MRKVTVEIPLIPTTKQSRLFWMKSSEQIFAPLDIQVNYTLFPKNIYLITKRIIRTYTLIPIPLVHAIFNQRNSISFAHAITNEPAKRIGTIIKK